MNLNLTVNETCGSSESQTAGTFHVRAFYSEADAGHLYGPFSTKERAEQCVQILAGRSDVVRATIE